MACEERGESTDGSSHVKEGEVDEVESDMIYSDLSSELAVGTTESGISTRLLIHLQEDIESADYDSDDDDGPPRKRRPRRRGQRAITMLHELSTPLDLVGQQLWKGSLLLADFVLANDSNFRDKIVLELGGGVGLLAVVLGLCIGDGAVYVTDRDSSILDLTSRNVEVNSHVQSIVKPRSRSIQTRVLDWSYPQTCPYLAGRNAESSEANGSGRATSKYGWVEGDSGMMAQVSCIFVADCIYDEDLTDALFVVLRHFLTRNPEAEVFLSLEKRFNFELSTLSVRAHGYRRFLHHIGQLESEEGAASDAPADGLRLRGSPLPVDFPTCFDYNRVSQLELWKVTVLVDNSDNAY